MTLVALPNEVLMTLLASSDPETILPLCASNIQLDAVCQEPWLWKRWFQNKYGEISLPEKIMAASNPWKQAYIIASTPRRIKLCLIHELREEICFRPELNYLMSFAEVRKTFLTKAHRFINTETFQRRVREAGFVPGQDYIAAMTYFIYDTYPHKITNDREWKKAYISGIEEIEIRAFRHMSSVVGFIRLENNITKTPIFVHFPFKSDTTVGEILLLLDQIWLVIPKRNVTLHIPLLGVNNQPLIIEKGRFRWKEEPSSASRSIVSFLTDLQTKNDQGFYPLIGASLS